MVHIKNFTFYQKMKFYTSAIDRLRNVYHKQRGKRAKWIKFKKDFKLYYNLDSSKRFELNWSEIYPWLDDKTAQTYFDGHYIYHPAWAARLVKQIAPEVHVDISSTLHFCSILSAYQNTEFYDYRPAPLQLDRLKTNKADLTNLHFESNSLISLSCMHTIEHIGLGRYGDPIDPDGDLKAIAELKRVTAPGGNLIIVVPVGIKKLAFNAHRIYSFDQICEAFKPLQLKEFALVPDNYMEVGMIVNATRENANQQEWGCGCFWFTK